MSVVPQAILDLVARFERNREAYRSGQYNEEQARHEFVAPFFKALGWDVDNERGYSEAYKDVIHEESIKIGSATEAPDYTFRIGGTRKFFVEAKKPSVNLKEDISPAYQLRRYAWSARLPLSILTDFEEFAVYDCRLKPDKADKASTARVMYLDCSQYPQHWEEVAGIFSREEVLKGSFDRYVESSKAKKGTAEVDDAFLESMGQWREALARNFALRNPELGVRELNEAVQRTIDRIIFLRICEDRGVEVYGRLMALLNGEQTYARLLELYRQADERYNSGLFHFRPEKGRPEEPDTLTPSLTLDDKVLREIIKNLYYPDSPYEFSVIGADILGQVYEQFLGKVIRLTAGHQAKVEEKPEVRKAGGVYYTPTYIVDYIVQNTVGKLLEGKTPRQVAGEGGAGGRGKGGHRAGGYAEGGHAEGGHAGPPLRILDPACGSGSFLLGAYQYLLDWHHDQYVTEGPEKWATGRNPRLHQGMNGDWHLTTSERKRILLEHIYGVDIDSQAVEVTKLNLLLKALEGENEETLTRQLAFFHERALPDLGENIKCGNSLIGPDYYAVGARLALPLLDEEEMYRVNPFDWQAAFPRVFAARPGRVRARKRKGKEPAMQADSSGELSPAGSSPLQGGFDVVIGNPPYVRQEMLGELKEYFQRHYRVYHGTADLYTYFIERGVSLLRPGGLFSYIVANKWLRANYGQPLRRWLKEQEIEEIVDFGDLPVFEAATTYPCIIRIRKGAAGAGSVGVGFKPTPTFNVAQVETLDFGDLNDYVRQRHYPVNRATLEDGGWSLAEERAAALLIKLRAAGVPLGEYVKGRIYRGVLTGLNEAFIIDAETRARLIAEDPRSAELIKPFLMGRDIKRYEPPMSERYLIFTRRGVDIKRYPAIERHLAQFKDRLLPKPKGWKGEWHGRKPGPYKWYEIQDTIDYYAEFERPKIIYPDIAARSQFTYAPDEMYMVNTMYFMPVDDLFLLGLLNSRVLELFIHAVSPPVRGGYYRYFSQYVLQLPIRPINFSDPADRARHDQMVALVERMLELHRQLAAAKTPTAKELLGRQIAATDQQIDRLVYALYGLTEEEVRICREGGLGL